MEKHLNVRHHVRLSVILSAFALYSVHGWADAWQQAVSAKISTEYDTNPAMLPGYRDGVWRSLFEPGYTLKNSSERNEFSAGISFQIVRSSNQAQVQNRNDPAAFIGWRRLNNTGELGISAKYDEVATRYAQIDNTGPGFADSTRASRTLSGNWKSALSERSTFLADGTYQKYSYKGGSFVDYVNQSAGLKYSYALSERNTLFLSATNVKYVPVGGNPSSNHAIATFGWEWQAADYLDGSLQVGKSISSDVGKGTQGAASVNYRGQLSGLVLSASRQVTPSGLGGFITVDQANGSWNYEVSERSIIGIDSGWQRSRFDTNIYNRSEGAWLQNELSSFWIARTYYLHKSSQQSGVGRAYSNLLGIVLTYTHADI